MRVARAQRAYHEVMHFFRVEHGLQLEAGTIGQPQILESLHSVVAKGGLKARVDPRSRNHARSILWTDLLGQIVEPFVNSISFEHPLVDEQALQRLDTKG